MAADSVGRRVSGRGMRYAAATALAAVAFGILVQRAVGAPWWAPALLVGVGLVLARASRGWSLLAALAGAAGLLALARVPRPAPDELFRQGRFRGVVVEEPSAGQGRAVVALDAPDHGLATLWFDQEVAVRCGDRLEVRAQMKRLSFPRNPGVFDRNEYYRRRGFVGEATAGRLEVSRLPGRGGPIVVRRLAAPARRHVRRVLAEVLPGTGSEVMDALLLGERSGLDPQTAQAFTDAGVLHVLAVSGLHVAVVAGLLWLVLGVTGLRGWWRFGVALIGVAGFVVVTGARPSAVRAGVMASVLLLAAAGEQRYDPVAALGVAGLVLLGFEPRVLFESGFQLSFVAAGSIALVMSRVREWRFPATWRPRAGRVVRRWLVYPSVVALAAAAATAPLLLHHFGRCQPLGVLASLLVVPLVGLVLPLGLVVLLVHPASPALASVFGASLNILVDVLLAVVRWFGGQSWAIVETGSFSWFAVACCYLALAACWNWRRPRVRVALLAALLAALNVGVWQLALAPSVVRAVFLDPGRGDALVLSDRFGRAAVVDAGIDGEGVLRDYLRAGGIRRVELVAVTHPDRDHYGGLLDLPASVYVETVIVPTLRGDSIYRELLHRLAARGARVVIGGQGTDVRLGDWSLDFIWPSPVARARFARGLVSTNDLSLVAVARHDGRTLLLTGDLDEPRILERTASRAWLLKSPHHGSRQGNPDLLIDIVRPGVMVVMGRWPTPARLEDRLTPGPVRLVNTRRDGAWRLEFRGGAVREVCYRPAVP